MRRKNTRKSQTNFYPARKLILLSAVLLSFLAGGCETTFTSKHVWEKTKITAKHAYRKTQKAVTNTLISIVKYQRDHANEQKLPSATNTKDEKGIENIRNITTRPVEKPRPDDRFPSRMHSIREENLDLGESRKTAKAITRSNTSEEILFAPHTTMTLEELRQRIRDIEQERIRSKNPDERSRLASELKELEQILLTHQKEENIIEEMTQLRRRLRKLQQDLLEIQKTSP